MGKISCERINAIGRYVRHVLKIGKKCTYCFQIDAKKIFRDYVIHHRADARQDIKSILSKICVLKIIGIHSLLC